MVDIPKDGNGDGTTEDDPSKKQPKRRRQRRRSKTRHSKNGDFGTRDIDGMDDDVGDEQEPAPTGHWKATLTYDVYMVDTPKDGDGEETAETYPLKKQPKRQC